MLIATLPRRADPSIGSAPPFEPFRASCYRCIRNYS